MACKRYASGLLRQTGRFAALTSMVKASNRRTNRLAPCARIVKRVDVESALGAILELNQQMLRASAE